MFKIFENYPKVAAILSERKDGSMKIFAEKSQEDSIWVNRKRFVERNGIDINASVGAYLCHGKNVEQIFPKDKGKVFKSVDGLFTKERGIFLSVTVADCLPIFIYDKEKEIVALVHAGWRGLEKNIISEAISKMKSEGSLAENILVGIGPAIGKCHYEVGEEVAEKFSKFGVEAKKEENGKIFLDIKKIAEIQLIESGVLSKNIEVSGACTFCEKEKYFSFRRDTGGDARKLRAMMAIIGTRK